MTGNDDDNLFYLPRLSFDFFRLLLPAIYISSCTPKKYHLCCCQYTSICLWSASSFLLHMLTCTGSKYETRTFPILRAYPHKLVIFSSFFFLLFLLQHFQFITILLAIKSHNDTYIRSLERKKAEKIHLLRVIQSATGMLNVAWHAIVNRTSNASAFLNQNPIYGQGSARYPLLTRSRCQLGNRVPASCADIKTFVTKEMSRQTRCLRHEWLKWDLGPQKKRESEGFRTLPSCRTHAIST
jgi:hypothetical protein